MERALLRETLAAVVQYFGLPIAARVCSVGRPWHWKNWSTSAWTTLRLTPRGGFHSDEQPDLTWHEWTRRSDGMRRHIASNVRTLVIDVPLPAVADFGVHCCDDFDKLEKMILCLSSHGDSRCDNFGSGLFGGKPWKFLCRLFGVFVCV